MGDAPQTPVPPPAPGSPSGIPVTPPAPQPSAAHPSPPAATTLTVNQTAYGTPDQPLRQTVGPYTVTRYLGRGGTALVLEARAPDGSPVALKVMDETPLLPAELLVRFRREAEASRRLGPHPSIVRVLATGQSGASHYIAMELVPGGRTLASLVAQGPLPVLEALRLGLQVAAALRFAHTKGVIHRDVKPGNVLINEPGDALLADFGLARLSLDTAAELTLSRTSLGTPSYMSPEQTRSAKTDHRTDIYSFGVVLYELLIGRLPYDIPAKAGVAETMATVREQDPRPPRRLRPEISRSLQAVLLKLLEKNPADRYPAMDQVIEDLHACLQARPVSVRPPTVFDRADRLMRRHRAVTAAAVASGVTAVGLTLYYNRLLSEARFAQLGAELEVSQHRGLQESRNRGPDTQDPASPEAALHNARLALQAGDGTGAAARLRALVERCQEEGLPELARTTRHELARALLATGDGRAAARELRQLTTEMDGSPEGDMAWFEEGLARDLAGDRAAAERLWREQLRRPSLPASLAFLCGAALGDVPPPEAARRAADQLPLIRSLGFWLAAVRSDDPAAATRWRAMAAESSQNVLPWLYCHLVNGDAPAASTTPVPQETPP